jgi:predicted methyltransferase
MGIMGPLLTLKEVGQWRAAQRAGHSQVECSLDLQRSLTRVELRGDEWLWNGDRYPYPAGCRPRTIYHWQAPGFAPVARYGSSLVKLVPTEWGAPTFEIDGIKMLPTARVSPYADAQRKVALIQPLRKTILDTCGGLGYFAAWCASGGAAQVVSYEKNPDVLWLRSLNPWSPGPAPMLTLTQADITAEIGRLPRAGFDAILHDPPRFGIAGELYSQAFYDELARVARPGGLLFHYTGTPNKLTSGRDVPREVARRLQAAGFATRPSGDGVLAERNARGTRTP